MPPMSALERSVRRFRRRTVLASWLGRSLAWLAPAALVAAGAVLLARALLGWPAERAAILLAPLALLPLAAILPTRRRAPGGETCAAWLDLRSGARGLVLAATERPDPRWAEQVDAVLARELELPPLALRRPASLALGALAFALAALAIPIAAPTGASGGFSERIVSELVERVQT